MSYIAVNENFVAVANGLHIDCYDHENHKVISISSANTQNDDRISDMVISSDNKYLAVITSTSKQLKIYNLSILKEERVIVLPRSASKIRFTIDNTQILVADKTGDGLIYNILTEDSGTQLLGHLSLLLNILQTSDGKYIITADRDEKIRVTCYPKTYIIHSYCLGHKEFVNHLELLPHDERYLISTSGDGTIKFWNYEKGALCYTIDTYIDVNDESLKEEFKKYMDGEGIEVDHLPIVHFTVMKISESCSLIAASVHLVNKVFIYTVDTKNEQFTHKLKHTLNFNDYPSAIKLHTSFLYVYIDAKCEILKYKITSNVDKMDVVLIKNITMFNNIDVISDVVDNRNSIKVLYKRKFDNVQEYQERKKQRLAIATDKQTDSDTHSN
ncbi:tRNA (guanine-N(7)-)-methyltransferase non-catalytic subunit wuho [Epargyreus clarus]|uniref:tRNA (guanine-N(7)-)-methyltransferase non-catalytic subunit wuho n=1 Tax=Epargyreus clarus TaxID=520877 RepID=UPI003C2CD112